MSRKIIANRKFLEEQVRTLLEYDPEENERNPPFIEPPEQDLGNTDKLPGEEDLGAVNVDSLELSDPLDPTIPAEVIIELLKTVFFGMKSSRDQVMQIFGDHYKYGSVHALANIHKSLDQVDNLTAFEAFAFRFLELDFKPATHSPRIDLKWKSEIFKEINSIVKDFALKIDTAKQTKDLGVLYREFIETAYKNVFVKYKLSDELDPVLSSPFMFGGIDPDNSGPMKVTSEPTDEFIQFGLKSLVKHIDEGEFPDPDGEDIPPSGVTVKSISEFLEKQLTTLTYPLSTGKNPEEDPITSFEKMRDVAEGLDIFKQPSSKSNLASKNRMLAAVAIREQSAANKRFVPLAVSLADVLLSLIGSASILVGLPGFGRFLATFPIRAYGWLGNKAAKETMVQIKKRFAKSGPSMFALGMVEFAAGLSVAFSQIVGDVSNRLDRIKRLHGEFFSLISQAKDPDNKEYSYVEKNVDSGPYTLDQLGKTYDAVVGMFSSDDQDSKTKFKNQVPDSLRKISKEDIQKTLNRILVGSETTKLGFDLDSQAQEFLANQPFEGSSIMEAWRDIYTLMIDLHLAAVIQSVKPGDKKRILSTILSESGDSMQKGYEDFMLNVENLYRSATTSDNFELEKKKIEDIYRNFESFVELAKEHAKKIEQDSKKVEPLLNKIKKATMPYDITSNKQQKTNESIILEKASSTVGGHTIKNINAPADAGTTKNQWVEVNHTDFREALILTKPVADAFIKMRGLWAAQAISKGAGKLIPSSHFRKAGDKSKGNHDIGSALDLITPKGSTGQKRVFIDYVIKLGWQAGFRGFGFPQTTPCSGSNGKCNTHIDLNDKGGRWWMYDDDGNIVDGDSRWDYRDAGWFGRRILAKSELFKILMGADCLEHEAEHKKAIKEYNEEDTLTQKIERGIRRKLRSSGLNEPAKLAKKIMKTSKIFGTNVNDNINDIINNNKKTLGRTLNRTSSRVNKKYQKAKYLKVGKVLDKEYNEKNYNKKLESIEEIQDFKDLVVRYTSNFGLSSSNVTGRVSIVSKYAADMDKPNLGAFYRNKKKEFERNILSRYKQKKIAAAKNKKGTLEESKSLSKQALQKKVDKWANDYETHWERMVKLWENISFYIWDQSRGRFDFGFEDSQLDYKKKYPSADFDALINTFKKLHGITREIYNDEIFGPYVDAAGMFLDAGVIFLNGTKGRGQAALAAVLLANPVETDAKYRKAVRSVRRKQFTIPGVKRQDGSTIQPYLEGHRLPSEYKAGLQNIVQKIAEKAELERQKAELERQVELEKERKLAITASKMAEIEYNVVIEYIREKGEEKKIDHHLTGPEDLSAPESVGEKSYKIKSTVANIILKRIQAKIDEYDFSNMKVSFVNTIASLPYKQKRGGRSVAYVNASYDSKTGIARVSFPLKIAGLKPDIKDILKIKNPINPNDFKSYLENIPSDRVAIYGLLGKLFPDDAPETGSHRWFSHKRLNSASLNMVSSSDTKTTEFDPRPGKNRMSNAGAPGYFDVDDAYKVHEFMKRDRLIEYIPVDMLMFTEKTIFTVTHDMPGNGFDAFSDVNPTVVEGRAPFDKAAPGQREGDRQSLIVILKRNLDVFEKFLVKLESLPKERIEIDRYSVEDYRIYKEYFESYIKLISTGISILENRGLLGAQETIRNSYFLNLMSAAMYNL